MLLGSKIVGATEEIHIVAGASVANLVHQLDETQVEDALGGWIRGRFAFWAHGENIVRRNGGSFSSKGGTPRWARRGRSKQRPYENVAHTSRRIPKKQRLQMKVRGFCRKNPTLRKRHSLPASGQAGWGTRK